MKTEMIDCGKAGVWKYEPEEMVTPENGSPFLRKARWVFYGYGQPQRIPVDAMEAFLKAQKGLFG